MNTKKKRSCKDFFTTGVKTRKIDIDNKARFGYSEGYCLHQLVLLYIVFYIGCGCGVDTLVATLFVGRGGNQQV